MKTRHLIQTSIFLFIVAGIYSCKTIPKGAEAVSPFYKEKYLGKWYEVARLDFKFEKNLNNTTAEYSLNDNGTIKVDNQGYNTKKDEWSQAIGKAKFVDQEDIAMLKVSFFGPFYSGYNVIAIDPEYQYALVAGKNTDYLWILSRETSIPDNIKAKYLKIAEDIGFKTSDLLWIEHDKKK
jgi:apolipoprotein D and lipocalin family protein